jgi:hypothetical protein
LLGEDSFSFAPSISLISFSASIFFGKPASRL